MIQLADLPTRRSEEWKYSDLRLALRDEILPTREGAPPHGARAPDGPIDRLALAQEKYAITNVPAGAHDFLIERFEAASLDARVREIRLAPGAALTRVVIQTGVGPCLSAAYVSLGAGATFRQFILAEGGALARIETRVTME